MAHAADMPVKAPVRPAPTSSWTGFYFGGEIGERSAVVDPSVAASTLNAPAAPRNVLGTDFCGGAAPQLPCPGATSLDNVGFRGGLYGGINWQVSRDWVAGFEGDFAWADRSRRLGGQMYPGGSPAFALAASTFTAKTTWNASARARLGVLVLPNVLRYGAGGVSWLHVGGDDCSRRDLRYQWGGSCRGIRPGRNHRFHHAAWMDDRRRHRGHWWSHWLVRGEYRYADYAPGQIRTRRAWLL
jgi:outer membrane immunogenic protein